MAFATSLWRMRCVLHAIYQETFSHLASKGMLYIAPNVYLGLVRAHISPENQHKQPQESH
jgi:hypothetical protein